MVYEKGGSYLSSKYLLELDNQGAGGMRQYQLYSLTPMKSINNKSTKSLYSHYKDAADDAVALEILNIIEDSKEVSQRKITRQTGLATGLVHSYMKRIINKGWVKAKQVSAKRWLYYVTPEGFLEKSRLTIKYLSVTLENYRSTQEVINNALELCRENGWTKLVVAGTDQLAEILILNIRASNELELAGVVSEDLNSEADIGIDPVPFDQIHNLSYDRILASEINFIEYCRGLGNSSFITDRLIHLGTEGTMNGKKR